MKSSLGEIISSDNEPSAKIKVDLRVGDYKFDNTNFLDFGFSFFGSGDDEEQFQNRRAPLNPDYQSMRRELWLATDAAYKQVSEVYSKKSSVIKNRMRTDTTHDFVKYEPVKIKNEIEIPQFDSKKFSELIKILSKEFKKHPQIDQSTVGIEFIPEKTISVNSEGREIISSSYYVGLEIVATTQTEDGMPLMQQYTAFSINPDKLPTHDSLIKAVNIMSQKLVNTKNAKLLTEPYSGPILFEGQAAAELFAQIFAPNLVTQRMPLTERGVQESDRYTAFQTKIGGRVLPEFLSVSAIPSTHVYQNMELLGAYKYDDDGIKAEDVALVKDGFLKTLLSSRVPTRRVRTSNGHKRGGAAMLSVIHLKSTSEYAKTSKELRERLIKLCKDRELEYGLVIKSIPNQNILYTTLMRIGGGKFTLSRSDNQKPLIEVYKVYHNGKEELIRGVEAKGLSVQSFKDILNVGKSEYVLNYLAPSITSPYMSGGSAYVGATMIVPDLLFEDGEIRPVESDFPKPPILTNPLSEKK
jgi:predicted Zn-dependent protease